VLGLKVCATSPGCKLQFYKSNIIYYEDLKCKIVFWQLRDLWVREINFI
jgi:hypothetical protein